MEKINSGKYLEGTLSLHTGTASLSEVHKYLRENEKRVLWKPAMGMFLGNRYRRLFPPVCVPTSPRSEARRRSQHQVHGDRPEVSQILCAVKPQAMTNLPACLMVRASRLKRFQQMERAATELADGRDSGEGWTKRYVRPRISVQRAGVLDRANKQRVVETMVPTYNPVQNQLWAGRYPGTLVCEGLSRTFGIPASTRPLGLLFPFLASSLVPGFCRYFPQKHRHKLAAATVLLFNTYKRDALDRVQYPFCGDQQTSQIFLTTRWGRARAECKFLKSRGNSSQPQGLSTKRFSNQPFEPPFTSYMDQVGSSSYLTIYCTRVTFMECSGPAPRFDAGFHHSLHGNEIRVESET